MERTEDKIRKYCGDIEERIKACRSKEAALMVKRRMCGELKEHCKSEIIYNTLSYRIDRLIHALFDEDVEDTSRS